MAEPKAFPEAFPEAEPGVRAAREGGFRHARRVPFDRQLSGVGVQYTVSASVFLAVVVLLRLRRRTQSRSRVDEGMTVVSAVTLGVLIAATPLGQVIESVVESLAAATR
ncbi:hypothetical protein [Kitasatospora sp. NPDC088134]|uniref:hypothetical protein n=1 Tax=Kitasatospora sp. NPDC088134 TaxID=3364071 RepID=UPI0037FB53B1